MKRGTPDHWKMKDLARRCKVPAAYALPWANGVMERIWHYAEKYCLQGDIGKVPNEEIAEACCWPVKRADELIEALVGAKWLDFSEKHRLLIHDWPDHCTDAVKKTLKNRDLEFFFPENSGKLLENSGTFPPALALPKPLPKPVEEEKKASPKIGSAQKSIASRLSITDLPEEWQRWSSEECGWDATKCQRVWLIFRDYWLAESGAKARKVDWLAAWRGWCRRETDRDPNSRSVVAIGSKRRDQASDALPFWKDEFADAERLQREMELGNAH